MSTTIIDFWKANPSYWITPPSKYKEVDEIIYDKFWRTDWVLQNLIGQIIYLDQFSRHFARLGRITEYNVVSNRLVATNIIKANIDALKNMDEIEIVFALMPFKHMNEYDFIFEYLHEVWLDGRHIINLPILEKFYIDTYKKAFTLERVRRDIITSHKLEPYDPNLICEYYPERYLAADWNIPRLSPDSELLNDLNITRKVTISLSGGVDSMVMLACLKHSGADVSAIHIIYGNRSESEHEYRFLAEFCYKLGVALTVYRIKWLRRGEIDRTFYENITRNLRFAAYHACFKEDEEPCILLGHIKEDIIENIWTNIAHSHHLGNLKKMEAEEVQLGVRIMRPLLYDMKSDIYKASEVLAIPYLKNTTPSWSNRGKFREKFHKATVSQFGESIDDKIIEFAEAVKKQNDMLYRLLYIPIYNSYLDGQINITPAIKAELDPNAWLNIFEYVCHNYLKKCRPGIKSVRDFCNRLYKCDWVTGLNVELGKGIRINIVKKDDTYIMKFI